MEDALLYLDQVKMVLSRGSETKNLRDTRFDVANLLAFDCHVFEWLQ